MAKQITGWTHAEVLFDRSLQGTLSAYTERKEQRSVDAYDAFLQGILKSNAMSLRWADYCSLGSCQLPDGCESWYLWTHVASPRMRGWANKIQPDPKRLGVEIVDFGLNLGNFRVTVHPRTTSISTCVLYPMPHKSVQGRVWFEHRFYNRIGNRLSLSLIQKPTLSMSFLKFFEAFPFFVPRHFARRVLTVYSLTTSYERPFQFLVFNSVGVWQV